MIDIFYSGFLLSDGTRKIIADAGQTL